MSSLLSRRRFTAGALAAGAALTLPRVARAEATLQPHVRARREGGELIVTLALSATEAVSVPTRALLLSARLGTHTVALSNPEQAFMRRSRAGFRVGPPLALGAEPREYTEVRGAWPAAGGGSTLRVELSLHPRAQHVRASLASVVGWRGAVEVAGA